MSKVLDIRYWLLGIPLLLVIGYWILPLPTVTAQVSPTLSVSPPKFDLVVIPGQLQQVGIKVTNQSSVAVPLKAVVMDFAPADDKGGITVGQSLPDHSAVSWFQIPQPELILKPNETRAVNVNLSPPENTPDRSYFALVMFQSQLPSTYFAPEAQAKIVPWIGTLFLLRVGELVLSDQILSTKSFNFPRFSISSELPVELELTNHTEFHLPSQTEFRLETRSGQLISHSDNLGAIIMPGRSRAIATTLLSTRVAGVYQAKASVRVASLEKTVTSQPIIYVSPKLIVGLAIIFLVALFGWRLRRNLIVARIKN